MLKTVFRCLLHDILYFKNPTPEELKHMAFSQICFKKEKKFRVWWILSSNPASHNYHSEEITSYIFSLDWPFLYKF